jgi:hypothetical protein
LRSQAPRGALPFPMRPPALRAPSKRGSDRSTTARLENGATPERCARYIDNHRRLVSGARTVALAEEAPRGTEMAPHPSEKSRFGLGNLAPLQRLRKGYSERLDSIADPAQGRFLASLPAPRP